MITSPSGLMIIVGMIALVFALYMLFSGLGEHKYARGDRPWVSVFSAERSYEIDAPIRLRGIPDLVGIDAQGRLVIVDLKTRKVGRAYPSDRIQLSVYALLLAVSTGREVSDYGYIAIRNQAGEKFIRVKLMSFDDVIQLYRRHQRVVTHPEEAAIAENQNLCRSCTFNGRECVKN